MEEASIWKASQKSPAPKKRVVLKKQEILLKAAIELDPEYHYDFRMGTLGPTLYIEAANRKEASQIRKNVPGTFEGYPTIVIYREPRGLIEEEELLSVVWSESYFFLCGPQQQFSNDLGV